MHFLDHARRFEMSGVGRDAYGVATIVELQSPEPVEPLEDGNGPGAQGAKPVVQHHGLMSSPVEHYDSPISPGTNRSFGVTGNTGS